MQVPAAWYAGKQDFISYCKNSKMGALQNTDYSRYIMLLLEVIIFIIMLLSNREGLQFCPAIWSNFCYFTP